ncbi:hypothetical protein H5410_023324 [Solanum commersonii]|uniref:Uncharacterized protein n=1 Tax=Solanum commersonii TaxID=4109 RepID=A0A9J5ZGI8_SOLCO|nr:hypothetical protein H5410_023324 [Solanum commersonii]
MLHKRPDYILRDISFAVGELPFKYTGVSLSSKKITIHQYMPLFLSYDDRVQLIKSILLEMQAYRRQIFLMPKKVIELATIICWTFIWTNNTETSRRIMVAWDTLSKPKSAGGLNMIDFQVWNKETINKLLWGCILQKLFEFNDHMIST